MSRSVMRRLYAPRFIALAATIVATFAFQPFAAAQKAPAAKAKYVFLFIGDGMAMPQISSAEAYARGKGMKVGIVSSVSLDHATPACFYASSPSRGNYYDIGVQLAKSGYDYFAGGAFLQPTGKDKDKPDLVGLAKEAGYAYANSKADFLALKPGKKALAVNAVLQDSKALPYDIDRGADDLSLADYTRKGIELLDGKSGFFMMVEGGKIDWACHANDAASSIRDTLALDAAVAEAVAFAAKHPKDTLIVVTGDHETGGMAIGFSGTGYYAYFDKVAAQKMSYVAFNDTILKAYKDKLAKDPALKAAAKLDDLAPAIKEAFGLDLSDAKALSPAQRAQLDIAFQRSSGILAETAQKDELALLYGGYEPLTVKLTQIMNQNAGIGWTTYAHSGVPVPAFAQGAGQELFSGYYDNTDIFRKLAAAMCIAVAQAGIPAPASVAAK